MSDLHAGTKAGEERYFAVSLGLELEFRWIPHGKPAASGSLAELGRKSDDGRASVKVMDGYWIAANETTVATWQKVMGAPPPKSPPTRSNQPLVRVSWYDCMEFIKRLEKPPEGWRYDLPSESEWEHACQLGSEAASARKPADPAWLDMKSGGSRQPIGLKHPNPWSVRDMYGNAAEWCRDSPGPERLNAAIRGESCPSDFNSRAASRNSDTPFLRVNRAGFRLVLVRHHPDVKGPGPETICKSNRTDLP